MARSKKPTGIKTLGTKTRSLPVKLTPQELEDRSQRLAEREGKLRDHIAETKQISSDRKAVKDAIDNEVRQLGQVVRSKQEYRNIDVRVEAHYSDGIALEIREDTEEVIDRRRLTPDETQGALFEDSPEAP